MLMKFRKYIFTNIHNIFKKKIKKIYIYLILMKFGKYI